MSPVRRVLLTLVLGTALNACGSDSQAPGSSTVPLGPHQILTTTATVRYVGVEGGCWNLDTNEGRFTPLDLPAQYRVDGLQVQVVLRDAPDWADMCMTGPLVQIDHISGIREAAK